MAKTIPSTTIRTGRPPRSKASYNSEIQQLKRKNRMLTATKEDLLTLLEGTNEAYIKYRHAPFIKRVKYIFKGDI